MPFTKGQSGNPIGRPRSADKNAGAVAKAEKQIRDRLPWLIEQQFSLAEGVFIEERTNDGRLIYQKPPDYKALAYLIDRIMGKPTERQEQEHSGGLTIKVVYAKPGSDPNTTETP